MNLDVELKNALRRVEPPPGFADRVMRRVAPASAGRLKPARTLAAAAALIAAMLGGWGVHETLRARNELLVAVRIASQKVAHAQQEIRK
ncbi:MAG TPA: hypothetical protein VKU62_08040 [Thermoanaerobaculia bacterium]|nr:hypothetical protein [Thermoanaerobaculia bacterium]